MRLQRGAGIDGLSGMRTERLIAETSPVTLSRPLLGFEKSASSLTVTARDLAYVEDPTNADDRYERSRVRSALSNFGDAGLSPQAVATSARRLGDARDALVYAEERFIASLALSFGNEIFATLDRRAFDDGPAYLRQKVLAGARYGGDSPEPRLSEIEALAAHLQRDEEAAATLCATLGGAMISGGPRFIRIWREAGRLDQRRSNSDREMSGFGTVDLCCAGLRKSWTDGRRPGRLRHYRQAVGACAYRAILPRLRDRMLPPARASAALPSFWAGEQFVAAPSLAPFALAGAEPLDPAGFDITPLAAGTF